MVRTKARRTSSDDGRRNSDLQICTFFANMLPRGPSSHPEATILIRFAAQNAYSLRNYSEITFVASSLKDDQTDLLSARAGGEDLLPALAIYGANASGKSNILASLRFFREFIIESHRDAPTTPKLDRVPFLLDEESRTQPTKFDADFIVDGTRYHYGYALSDTEFVSEWLYSFPKGRRQTWFVRESGEFEFGKNFTGKNRTIAEFTPKNSLFLSSAAHSKHDLVIPIFNFFRDSFLFYQGESLDLVQQHLNDDESRDLIMAFMAKADFGVSDGRIRERKIPQKSVDLLNDFLPLVRRHMGDDGDPLPALPTARKEPQLGHRGEQGKTYFISWSLESQGTRQLVALLGPLLEALRNGKILVIDEIDSSLHSLVAAVLVKAFGSADTNLNRAQLIFSTHDTNLLCSNCLRRDQIWFTEKDSGGETHLYPLTDISTRRSDNIERGYLEGRFGALPFVGDWRSLFDFSAPISSEIESSDRGHAH